MLVGPVGVGVEILDLVEGHAYDGHRRRAYVVRHEQRAVHLADGFYRVTGRPAVAFTSIGPGALN
ncbi:MAG: hypothetical protein C4551_01955 [Bacillota bacterium]|nr:MAG: hypothetical protein C4551_01955 [Bacillota bacterium]